MLEMVILAITLASASWLFWLLFILTTLLAVTFVDNVGFQKPLPYLCIPSVAVLLFYSYPALAQYSLLQLLEGVVIFLLGYLVIGSVYSIARWYFYLLKWRENTDIDDLKTKYRSAIAEFIKRNPGRSYEDRQEFNFVNLRWAVEQNIDYAGGWILNFPLVKNNKFRITTWIMCWPWSILSWLARDMILDAVMWIYRKLGFVYENITSAVLKNFIK